MKKLSYLFVFTKPERNGLIVLVFVLLSGLTVFLINRNNRNDLINLSLVPNAKAELKSDSFYKVRKQKPDRSYVNHAGGNSVFQQKELFFFDPNAISADEWIRLGFSPAQTRSIINFRDKGGRFKAKEDLKKLYVVSTERYAELESYITIPVDTNASFKSVKPHLPSVIELNTADTSLLTSINGIGPVFAHRIVAYRELLGGFHHKKQLLEVYGMDQDKYALIEPKLKVDSTYINKINVNQAGVSDLIHHPYFTPAVANAIVNYRKAHGPFQRLSDIMKCHLVNAELYRKIAPYLTI